MQDWKTSNVAFLWDESFLWGLMAYKALTSLGLPFDLVTAQDIQNGVLDKYKMLFVPGGWASNKSKKLGDAGMEAVRKFVERGGNYLGFCGGAGLATAAKGCLGLLNIKRRLTKDRVPSFSGKIELNIQPHPVWATDDSEHPRYTRTFHAWWPSQFIVEDSEIKVLASYGGALPDSFSSDLNVGDVCDYGSWEELEELYKINLDPKRLQNEPSVVEGTFGKGRVVLSLVHFDTPDDAGGRQVLVNLWGYLSGGNNQTSVSAYINKNTLADVEDAKDCSHLQNICYDLICLGERNFLWFWRNSMLLQWRRGVRGLEYNTLYIMMKEIYCLAAENNTAGADKRIGSIEKAIVPFMDKAKRLLVLERHALQKGHITYDRCDDREIKTIRDELFSASKSYGGMFKRLLDEIDSLLFSLLKAGGRVNS